MTKRPRPEAVVSAILVWVLTPLISHQVIIHSVHAFAPPTTTVYPRHTSVPFSSTSSSPAEGPIVIALTREEGKNGKLHEALLQELNEQQKSQQPNNVEVVELPCIAHAHGPDYDQLSDTLWREESWDYVAITSPEAARVLASAWNNKDTPQQQQQQQIPSVVAVGKATQQALEAAGIDVAFCPSKATAKVLVQELPSKSTESKPTTTVLYPASAKAKPTLQEGLTQQGFAVTRLDTYDTVTATWTQQQNEKAATAQKMIVCVASPSSLQGWLDNTLSSGRKTFLAACIGETSAQACREAGLPEEQIFYPDKPGISGWVQAVVESLEYLRNNTAHNKNTKTAGNSSSDHTVGAAS